MVWKSTTASGAAIGKMYKSLLHMQLQLQEQRQQQGGSAQQSSELRRNSYYRGRAYVSAF